MAHYFGSNPVKIITKGKNLIPFPYDGSSYPRGVEFTVNSDGTFLLNGVNNGLNNSYYCLAQNFVLKAGVTYTFSIETPLERQVYLSVRSMDDRYHAVHNGTPLRYRYDTDTTIKALYVQVSAGDTTVFNNILVKVMINEGETALPYEPYNQLWRVRSGALIRNPKNLIPFPHSAGDLYSTHYRVGFSHLGQGITYTIQEDGGIRLKGTVTGDTYSFYIFTWYKYNFPNGGTYTFGIYGEDNPKVKFEIRTVKDGADYYRKLLLPNTYTTRSFTDGEYIQRLAMIVDGEGATVDTVVYPFLYKGTSAEPYFIQD